MNRPPWFARVTAVLLGLLAAIAPSSLPLESAPIVTALLLSTVIFFAAGLVLGVLWPSGWTWGLWVVAPGFLLTTLGLITDGGLQRYLTDDLPFLACGLVGASLGALAGARVRTRRRT